MKEKLISAITNEYSRKKLQYICIYLFFSAVSAGMTALNLITGKGAVTVATALFSVLCLTNYFLSLTLHMKKLSVTKSYNPRA